MDTAYGCQLEGLRHICDRQMPVILHRDAYQTWLNGRPAQAKSLLDTYPPERMVTHAVGPHVNFLEYDDASLIRPIV